MLKQDVQAVLLPQPLLRGTILLVRRSLGLPADSDGKREAEEVVTALFGDSPVFGALPNFTTNDIRQACGNAGVNVPSVAGQQELTQLLRKVDPDIPVCAECGELPISNTGGKISVLISGARCPFCEDGLAELVPIKLRLLAWTDGRLVEPQTLYDFRSRHGEKIPLQDEQILEWVGGWIDRQLESALEALKVPIYAFLAYALLKKKVITSPNEAAELLTKPKQFGLETGDDMMREVFAARAYLRERERTNLPSLPRLAVKLGIEPSEENRFKVGGRTYIVEGQIGEGSKSKIYRAFWEHTPTERVVIKVAKSIKDNDLMLQEVKNLRIMLKKKTQGAEFFTRRIPQLVSTGFYAGPDGDSRKVTVLRDRNLHDWTLGDVLREYPDGVDPETIVWMWKRVLILLAWIHRSGMAHRDITPDHILIHPLNHAAVLIDWTKAGPKRDDGAMLDISMSARCMIDVLSGESGSIIRPGTIPEPLVEILFSYASYDGANTDGLITDTLELHDEFGKVAKSVFGPSKYHPFFRPKK